jgi:aerobic-type carbon monoxide dehydrogenase small subunit (CoxS/CutS family)
MSAPATAARAFTIVLNGREQTVSVDPDASLLSVLRDDLGLLGSRIGCSEGYCGACSVHVAGKPVQSCSTPLWSVEGKSVETIDSPSPGPMVTMVRDAFIAEQAAQCGYCVNGIVMSVAALVADPETRDRKAILHVLDERHICRCGAHVRIIRAIDRVLAELARQSGGAGRP